MNSKMNISECQRLKKNIYEKVKIKILQYKCMKFLFTKVEKLFIASTKGEYFKPSNFPSYIHNIQWPFPYKQYTYMFHSN